MGNLGCQRQLAAGPNLEALVPTKKTTNPHHFLSHPEDLCSLTLFPFWHGAEVWQGRKCHGPGGLISFVLWLPREDVEVSFQYFVSYCVATS